MSYSKQHNTGEMEIRKERGRVDGGGAGGTGGSGKWLDGWAAAGFGKC